MIGVSTADVSCDIESDLTSGFQRLECHLNILCGPQQNQVTVVIHIFHPQRAIISSRSTKPNLSADPLHKVAIFGGKGDLDDEDILVEMDFDFYIRVGIRQTVKPL